MRVGFLKKELEKVHEKAKVLVFVKMANGDYLPFENVEFLSVNGDSQYGNVHLDVNVGKEYKSVHFPDNLSKDEVDDLFDRRRMLLEELEELDDALGSFLDK